MSSEQIRISLPSGDVLELPRGSTVGDVAAAIGPGLAKAAVAGVVDGETVDLMRPLDTDAEVRLLTERAKSLDIDNTEGFYISEVTDGSGAEKAGLQKDDIIVKLDAIKISTYADLTGYISSKRPEDVVSVTFLRDGEEYNVAVTLSKIETSSVNSLGLELKNLDKIELKKLDLTNGVYVEEISNKELMDYGVKKGYVITAIDNQKVFTVEDVNQIVSNKTNGEVMRIEMKNLNGELERYIFR